VSRVGEKSGSAVEWTGMRESGSFGYPSGILRARDTAFIRHTRRRCPVKMITKMVLGQFLVELDINLNIGQRMEKVTRSVCVRL